MIKDRKIRIAVCRQNFFIFFHFYFAHYVKYKTASFHREIFYLASQAIQNLFIVAFRGSSKSTILTTAYPIWAILGEQQKKFVLILCQTRSQAKQHMMNLRRELENNLLLKNDLGPFQEETDEWGSASLVFSKLNARITAASIEQSIRGLRHNQYRPDLIIGDDVEDLASTKTRESRQKTYQWLTGEVIPAGDRNTRLIIVGNLLHEDSLLMHIKEDIEKGNIDGLFKEYPLISGEEILWPGKYPTMEDIEAEKRKAGNEFAWQREYLLRIVSGADKLVYREMIHYYKEFPDTSLLYTATGTDLAISQKDTADFTAMVSARVYRESPGSPLVKIYILPNPVNERLNFLQTVDRIKLIQNILTVNTPAVYIRSYIYIESVGYQEALVEQLKREGCYYVEGVPLHGQDKHARLAIVTMMIESGQILFPEKGAEALIEQLLGFGMEKHDDLVDAFTLLILKIMSWKHVVMIGGF